MGRDMVAGSNRTPDERGPDGITAEQWAQERLDNCYELAATKTGADRQGWLDDAWYWSEILKDIRRLNFLHLANKHMNERNRTVYGWKLEANHNRIALTDHNLPALSVRQAIDNAMDVAAANLARMA